MAEGGGEAQDITTLRIIGSPVRAEARKERHGPRGDIGLKQALCSSSGQSRAAQTCRQQDMNRKETPEWGVRGTIIVRLCDATTV